MLNVISVEECIAPQVTVHASSIVMSEDEHEFEDQEEVTKKERTN